MYDAADVLIKWLPAFEHTILGLEFNDAAIALDVLPRIKMVLAKLMKSSSRRGGGARPNVLRKNCARVVIEASRLIHGEEAKPRSLEPLEACNEYWQACGRECRGEVIENCRGMLNEPLVAMTKC